MKTNSLLLPHSWQIGGWIALALWLCFASIHLTLFGRVDLDNVSSPLKVEYVALCELMPYFSMILICLSREKTEDEFVQHIRAVSVFSVVLFLLVLGMLATGCERFFANLGFSEMAKNFLMPRAFLSSHMVAAFLYLLIFKSLLFYNWLKCRSNG